MSILIQSAQNQRVKDLQALLRDGPPKRRSSSSLMEDAAADETIRIAVEGEKLVNEALKSGLVPLEVFVQDGMERLFPFLREHENLLARVPPELLKKISLLETPPKIIGVFRPPDHPTLGQAIRKARTVVVLDRVQDPGNVGSIIRSCEALGANFLVLLRGSCSRFNQKVMRAAMGSWFRLPVYDQILPEELWEILEEQQFSARGADSGGDPIHRVAWPRKTALIFGAEGQGLHKDVAKRCHSMIGIPISPDVESLNVAVSVAICLHERNRSSAREDPKKEQIKHHDRID